MKIEIFEIIGEDCITVEDGERIYDLIFPRLIADEKVELNFSKVEVFASPFFNAAIGRLMKDLTREELNSRLTITAIANEGMSILKLVIKNSVQYYHNEQYQKAHDAVLRNPLEEG